MLGGGRVLVVQWFVPCAVKPCFLSGFAVLTESIWIGVSCYIYAQRFAVWRWPSPGWFSSGSHTLPLTPSTPGSQTPLSSTTPLPVTHHECLFWWIFHLSWSTLIQQTKGAFSVICIFSSSSFRPLLFSLNFSLSRSLSLSLWVERSVVFHAGLLVACWDMFGIPESQSKCLTHAGPQKKTHTHTRMHAQLPISAKHQALWGKNLYIKAGTHIQAQFKTKQNPMPAWMASQTYLTRIALGNPGAFPLPNWKCISCLLSWNETLIPQKKKQKSHARAASEDVPLLKDSCPNKERGEKD